MFSEIYILFDVIYLLPKDLDKCLLNDESVEALMQYFYEANQIVLKITEGNTKIYAEKAFYDTLGGYLNYFVIPLCKLSFYAGVITLKTTKHVFKLLEQCKIFLNTNGNGWRPPTSDFAELETKVEPLNLFSCTSDKNATDKIACRNLNLADEQSENDEYMIVSLPKLDPEEMGELSNIWLPFTRKHSFNLKSQVSAFILIKYFVTVSKCYHAQGVCQDTFNERFLEWIQKNIEPHLKDDVLYPGLGAVLQIVKTIQQAKTLTRSKPPVEPKTDNKKDDRKMKSSRESLKPKKVKQDIHLKSYAALHPMPSKHTNFFQKFFNIDESKTDVNIDEKTSELQDEDNLKLKRRNYIIAAVAVAVILLIFVCIVAVITKNLRKMSKGRSKVKNRNTDRKKELEDRKAAGGISSYLFGKNRYRYERQTHDEETPTSTSVISSASKRTHFGVRRHPQRRDLSETSQTYLNYPDSLQKPPEFNLNIVKSKHKKSKSMGKNLKKLSFARSPDRICQYCGRINLPMKENSEKGGTCFSCFSNRQESLRELATLSDQYNSQPNQAPLECPCLSSSSPQVKSPHTKLSSPAKQVKHHSPQNKTTNKSISPPKFSISKKNKQSPEAGNGNAPQSQKSPIRKKWRDKIVQKKQALSHLSDQPCSPACHPPGRSPSPSPKNKLSTSPKKHKPASIKKDVPLSPGRLQEPECISASSTSLQQLPLRKSCPILRKKREVKISSSWETLDSKR